MEKQLMIKRSNYYNIVKSYNSFVKTKEINDYELFILTTAITRPHLHIISFNNYKEFIPKDVKINWVINVDFVRFDKDDNPIERLEKTKSNILEIFKDFDNVKFTFNMNEKGNFNQAVRNITNITSNLISRNCKGIFYLEDDWFSTDLSFSLKNIINSEFDVFKLYKDGDPRKKLSFQPAVMKPHVWHNMFYLKFSMNKDLTKDPEKICQIAGDEFISKNYKYKVLQRFKDIGRDCDINDDNTIRGWFQISKNRSENISLSYIYIDKLIRTVIYIISHRRISSKYSSDSIYEDIKTILNQVFSIQVLNKILAKYEKDSETNLKYYNTLMEIRGDKSLNSDIKYSFHSLDSNLTLKNIYENIDRIDKLIETLVV